MSGSTVFKYSVFTIKMCWKVLSVWVYYWFNSRIICNKWFILYLTLAYISIFEFFFLFFLQLQISTVDVFYSFKSFLWFNIFFFKLSDFVFSSDFWRWPGLCDWENDWQHGKEGRQPSLVTMPSGSVGTAREVFTGLGCFNASHVDMVYRQCEVPQYLPEGIPSEQGCKPS